MKKFFLAVIIILISIGIFFSLKFYVTNNEENKLENPLNSQDNKNNQDNQESPNNNLDLSEDVQNENNEGTSEGTKESGDFNENLENNDKIKESSCVLVRPGIIPNIYCSVNSITKQEVSLKIKNEFGEKIGITLNLNICSPEIQDSIENNQEKDFIFYCNNKDYFNQELVVTYGIGGDEVDIGGFVIGPVSDK